MNDIRAELQSLYADSSKHSVYQNVPDFVSEEIGYRETIDDGWRSDRPRLEYLLRHRHPEPGQTWMDFGANTGFFALSLAHQFPESEFIAVEANPNHARFIRLVVEYFGMRNVDVLQRAVGYGELRTLPHADFLLHLNVLHHAGHDFDSDLVPDRSAFGDYATKYLRVLGDRADQMMFQMGNNWGGDRNKPLIATRNDAGKLQLFGDWLRDSDWTIRSLAYPSLRGDSGVIYNEVESVDAGDPDQPGGAAAEAWEMLDAFQGEFYRRPLFLCAR